MVFVYARESVSRLFQSRLGPSSGEFPLPFIISLSLISIVGVVVQPISLRRRRLSENRKRGENRLGGWELSQATLYSRMGIDGFDRAWHFWPVVRRLRRTGRVEEWRAKYWGR